MVTEVISFAQAVRRAQMCVMTSLGILVLLGLGAYSAGKSAWKLRSTVSYFLAHTFNTPDRLYKAVISKQKST